MFNTARQVFLRNFGARFLHIQKTFPIEDESGQIKAIILKTRSDKMRNEVKYIARSLKDLANEIPENLQDKPLLTFKINQSVIDSQALEARQEIKPLFHGHTLCCFSEIREEAVEVLAETLVSKVPKDNPFEAERSLIEDSDYRIERAEETGSGEYFIFIDPDKIGFDIEKYKKNLSQLFLDSDNKYILSSNSCGHAVYEACVGKKLKIDNISSQRATHKTIEKILLTQNMDKTFTKCFESAMIESGVSKQAHEIHFELFKSMASPSKPS